MHVGAAAATQTVRSSKSQCLSLETKSYRYRYTSYRSVSVPSFLPVWVLEESSGPGLPGYSRGRGFVLWLIDSTHRKSHDLFVGRIKKELLLRYVMSVPHKPGSSQRSLLYSGVSLWKLVWLTGVSILQTTGPFGRNLYLQIVTLPALSSDWTPIKGVYVGNLLSPLQ